jgi:dTDP-4-dehydrorhamnose reductase
MNILGTGLSGMVGSEVVKLLSNEHSFVDLSLTTGVDIRNIKGVYDFIRKSNANIVLHMAAKTDVDGCEKDRERDLFQIKNQKSKIKDLISKIKWEEWQMKSTAFAINVVGTLNIVEACKKFNKKLIYISTDFVFDGNLKNHSYSENETPNPVNHYGYTKWIGEEVVKSYLPDSLIVRFAYPYGTTDGPKKSFAEKIIEMLKMQKTISAPFDNLFTPSYIPDIALALSTLVQRKTNGLIHVCGADSLSSYQASLEIADVFGYDKNLIQKTDFDEYYKGKAPRPQWGRTGIKKLTSMEIQMKTFREGLEEMRKIIT